MIFSFFCGTCGVPASLRAFFFSFSLCLASVGSMSSEGLSASPTPFFAGDLLRSFLGVFYLGSLMFPCLSILIVTSKWSLDLLTLCLAEGADDFFFFGDLELLRLVSAPLLVSGSLVLVGLESPSPLVAPGTMESGNRRVRVLS